MKSLLFTTCLGLLAASAPVAAASASGPPNVLIVMLDDMGYGDVRALNPEGAGFETPHLDALVRHGVTFTQAHASASVCAPTRYALLTGNHVYRGRQGKGTWSQFEGSQILPGQKTIADVLRTVGYATAFFGKAHLGATFLGRDGKPAKNFDEADLSRRYLDGPRDHGFDYSLTLPAGIQAEPYAFFRNDRLARWNDGRKEWEHFETDAQARRHFSGRKSGKAKRAKVSAAYEMDNWRTETVGPLLLRDALAFIDRHVAEHGTGKPFFIHYCSQAGHTPYAPPQAFNVNDPMNTADLSAPGAIPVAGVTVNPRTDMIYEGDVALGLLVAKMREKGILENTLIIFTSDNGAAVGPQSTWSDPVYQDIKGEGYGGVRSEVGPSGRVHRNAQGVADDGRPLRGQKGLVYEGGHRVPLIIQWGQRIPAGIRVQDQLIGLHDLFATIASFAGAKVDADQGRDSFDFSRVWLDPAGKHAPVRDTLYIQSNRPWEKNPQPRNITWGVFRAEAGAGSVEVWKAVVEQVSSDGGRTLKAARAVELYHLSRDSAEARDVTGDARLQAIEHQFRSALTQPRTAPVPDGAAARP